MVKSIRNPTTNTRVGRKFPVNQAFKKAIMAKKNRIPGAALASLSLMTLTSYPGTGSPWHYKLGNRSALEWILDQRKETKDPTIREKFDTCRFADYKEKVIDLLKRVTRVSVETHRITEAMRTAKR